MNTHQLIAFILTLIVVVLTSISFDWRVDYKHDNGVLSEGTLVDYRYNTIKHNRQAIAIVNGKYQAVSTWDISYVDANGLFGKCDYISLSGSGSLTLNTPIKCFTGELQFN